MGAAARALVSTGHRAALFAMHAIVVALVSTSCASSAGTLDGRLGNMEGAPVLKITELTLYGVQSVPEEDLRAVIQTTPSPSPWASPRQFDKETLAADLQRIEAFYHSRGYPFARIVSHGVDVDESTQEARVIISIEEGHQCGSGSLDQPPCVPLLPDTSDGGV